MPRIRLVHGDCLTVLKKIPDNSVDCVVTDPPYLIDFMGKSWDRVQENHSVSPFEAWLSGFIAGEGCFLIKPQHAATKLNYSCAFTLKLRKDDEAVIRALVDRIGGTIQYADALVNSHGIRSSRTVRWNVQSKADCWKLAGILDKIPLFAKKHRDYILWRKALELWSAVKNGSHRNDYTELRNLHEQLKGQKKFLDTPLSDTIFDDPFLPPLAKFYYEWTKECLRILKPGGYLVSTADARTYHWLAAAAESSGFNIRRMISWIYGQSMNKGYDLGQSIEKFQTMGTARRSDRDLGGQSRNRWSSTTDGQKGGISNTGGQIPLTTVDAKRWAGWNTDIKSMQEPILIAQKPLSEKNYAANVLKWGVGAFNSDACRVPRGKGDGAMPGNVIHDGSDSVMSRFSEFGESKSRKGKPRRSVQPGTVGFKSTHTGAEYDDEGSPARFFYCAKPTAKEKSANGQIDNDHPTVKPIALMQYLVRLVCPKNGLVLDPFTGSGTTAVACIREGFRFIGIEKEAPYVKIATTRIQFELRVKAV